MVLTDPLLNCPPRALLAGTTTRGFQFGQLPVEPADLGEHAEHTLQLRLGQLRAIQSLEKLAGVGFPLPEPLKFLLELV